MRRQPAVLFCVCCIFYLKAGAQLYPFVNYTPRDGLVGNRIHRISQDSRGNLYFCTTTGISVYDGSRFTNYSTENGLAINMVNEVVEAGDDSMLVILNSRNLQYIRNGKIGNVFLRDSLCPVINQFIRCSNGDEYAIADDGLFRFEKDHFSRVILNGLTSINGDKNLGHVTELDSFLIINMEVFSPAYAAPKRFIIYNYRAGTAFTDVSVPDVYFSARTPDNELLLATAKGVVSLDRAALKEGKIKLLPPPRAYLIPPSTIPNQLFVDQRRNLWMVTAQGVVKFSPGVPAKVFSSENGLPDNGASCIFEDREGIMWFGSDLVGATKLVDQRVQFYKEFKPGLFVHDIYVPANNDSVWMYDLVHNRILLHYHDLTRDFPVHGGTGVFRIAAGKKKFYALKSHTICRLKPSPDGSFTVSSLYTDTNSIVSFNNLLIDKEENPIAIGSSIVVFLPGNKIIREPLGYFADEAVLTNDNLLYIVTRSSALFVYKLNPSNADRYLQLVGRYNWPGQNIQPRSIALDTSGKIWIGTRLRGLLCYSIENGNPKFVQQLTVQNGLTENFVKYLCCDIKGRIWASTASGLDKISFEGGVVHIENVTKASNMYLDIWKTESDKQGIIWAVTSTGLVKVSPSDESSRGVKPEIILARFTVNGKEQSIHQNQIDLEYFQNNLFFQVAVPSFFDEKKTQFSYRLDANGKPGTWTQLASRADISFLNLSSGHYVMRVRSIFLNGKYQPLEAMYSFTIMPPWWQTWWFVSIEFVTAFFLIITFFRLYYRNKLQKQLIILEKKQAVEKERTRIATDMHDDMGAGLSRIKILSETIKFENQKGIVDPSHLLKISAYSEEMMDKMGEIVWALNQRNDSMNDLLGYTRAYAVDYLTSHNIHCVFHAPAEHPEIFVSGEARRNIFLSVKEVLHNVVKHSCADGVEITITTNNELLILIHDNGKGINMDKTRRFGNGLNNITKRMTEIGGVAQFRNENGTTVLLRVSLDQLQNIK